MVARHLHCAFLVLLGSLGLGPLLWALPPCGPPGTITTVTAPEGSYYIAAFTDYTIYPPEHPGLMNRPICVRAGRVVITRPEERVEEILD